MREVRPGVWEDHPMGPPGLPKKPERNKAVQVEKPKENRMSDLQRLCVAMARRLSESAETQTQKADGFKQAPQTQAVYLTAGLVLNEQARAYALAAQDLEADERARLDIVGPQPKDLQSGE